MNLTLDDAHVELRDLAGGILAKRVTPDRLAAVAATADRFDADLWRELADTGLIGAGVGEDAGGLGLGVVGAALVCREVGRHVAAVPMGAATCAAAVLETADDTIRMLHLPPLCAGTSMVLVAPPQSVRDARVDAGRLAATLTAVPWAHVADHLLVAVGDDVLLVDPRADGVASTRGDTTAGEVALDLEIRGVEVEPLGGTATAQRLRELWLTLLAATQSGVTAAAVRMAADYTSAREQFGRPLSTNQAVAVQAADAYVDTTAIDAVALQAAWSLDAGLDATLAALTAGWWASEAGQHCVHVTQHLHGGIGADVTYPLHRYYLWGKQIELMCGAASSLLAELGDALAVRPDAGDAVVLTDGAVASQRNG